MLYGASRLLLVAGRKNPVSEACERVGGVLQAAVVAKVTPGTMYAWRRQGWISLLGPAFRLARASRIPVVRFVPPEARSD